MTNSTLKMNRPCAWTNGAKYDASKSCGHDYLQHRHVARKGRVCTVAMCPCDDYVKSPIAKALQLHRKIEMAKLRLKRTEEQLETMVAMKLTHDEVEQLRMMIAKRR